MKSTLEIDAENAEAIGEIVKPSLETDEEVEYVVETGEKLNITAKTDTLGRLRGVTDNALRLSLLSKKILDR